MGRHRSREIEVNIAAGEEIRVADAPSSEPIKNLTILVIPGTGGSAIPAGTGVDWEVFYGGGHDQPAQASGPDYNTGVSQASGNLAAASKLPVTLHEDASLLPEDRVRSGPRGMSVKVNYGTARALHLINNSTGPLAIKVKFLSESVSEAY